MPAALFGLLLLSLAAGGASGAPVRSLTAEGGDVRADLSDGRVLRGADLVSGELHLTMDGTPVALRIETAECEPAPRPPDVWLFRLTYAGADGASHDLCSFEPDGRPLAIPYPDGAGGIALTCSSGAIGKCFRFGYRP